MPKPEPPQPVATPRRFRWRRLLQYRLRTLLILMTVVAVLFAWGSHKARQQRAAAAAVKAVGGVAYYDFEYRDLQGPRYCPKWLVDTLGVDYFANVHVVFLDGGNITDTDLEQLKVLTALRGLILKNANVSDAGINSIQKKLPQCAVTIGRSSASIN